MRDIDEDAWHDEDDGPDDEDDTSDVEPCPACGADVYEDAEWCPSCDRYITRSTNPWVGKPWWWVVLGLAGIGAVLRLMMP